jgi:hypothetical protein
MNTLPERLAISGLIEEAVRGGARLAPACELLGFSERTFQRWGRAANDSPDGRTLRHDAPAHKFSVAERVTLLAVANLAEFGHLSPHHRTDAEQPYFDLHDVVARSCGRYGTGRGRGSLARSRHRDSLLLVLGMRTCTPHFLMLSEMSVALPRSCNLKLR